MHTVTAVLQVCERCHRLSSCVRVCVVVSMRAFVHIFAFVSVRACVSIRVIVFVRACVSVVNVICCSCKCGVLFAFVHECGRSYVCSCVLGACMSVCVFVRTRVCMHA